jgi:hypothetical protein
MPKRRCLYGILISHGCGYYCFLPQLADEFFKGCVPGFKQGSGLAGVQQHQRVLRMYRAYTADYVVHDYVLFHGVVEITYAVPGYEKEIPAVTVNKAMSSKEKYKAVIAPHL